MPTQAKALLKQYDPTRRADQEPHLLVQRGQPQRRASREYLQSQWQTNLGVNVNLNSVSDASIFISNRLSGKYVMSRDGWQFDYNHPQDWYDNLWGVYATLRGREHQRLRRPARTTAS